MADVVVKKDFILGTDVGFTSTGLSLYEMVKGGKVKFIAGAVISTKKDNKKKHMLISTQDVERLLFIRDGINGFLKANEINLHTGKGYSNLFVACELPTGGARGARPNRTMGLATGLIIGLFNGAGVTIIPVTPSEVKYATLGRPSGEKIEVINSVEKHFKSNVWDKLLKKIGHQRMEHFADSVGCAIHVKKHNQIIKMKYREME